MQTYTDGKCIHVPREYLVIGVLTLYNKMSPTGGCHQTVHYDSYTDHRGVEPVRQRKSELTVVDAGESQGAIPINSCITKRSETEFVLNRQTA